MDKEIYVKWEGPHDFDQIANFNGEHDYGIYMAFGNHRVYGTNVLLYIGLAFEQTFNVRMNQHVDRDSWYGTEKFYFGKLMGRDKISYHDWKEQVDYLETKYIQFCLPSWNSSKLNSAKKYSFDEAIIFNIFDDYHKSQLSTILPSVLCEWKFNQLEFETMHPLTNADLIGN